MHLSYAKKNSLEIPCENLWWDARLRKLSLMYCVLEECGSFILEGDVGLVVKGEGDVGLLLEGEREHSC
jgi:hypothetical protein